MTFLRWPTGGLLCGYTLQLHFHFVIEELFTLINLVT